MTYSPLRTQTHPWQPTESSTPSFTFKTKTWHCYQISRQRLGDCDNGQKMVLRRMLSPTQQSYFLRTTGYWSYWHYTETSYRIRQTNAQRWTYRQKKTNNTYYIRILNPNASIFSLKSMKSIILSLFTDPLFLFKVVRSWELVRRHVTLAVLLVRIMRLLTRCVPWEYLSCLVVRYTTFLATRNVYGRPLQGRQRKGRLRESCPRLGSWTSATKVKIGAITSSV